MLRRNRSLIGVAALSLALAVASSAGAQATPPSRDLARDPVNRADLQCMALMALAAGTAEEGSDAQLGSAVGMSYYLGRLEGRAPSVDWMAQLADYLTGDLQSEAKAQAERCSADMARFGGRMTDWGARLNALAAKQGGRKSLHP